MTSKTQKQVVKAKEAQKETPKPIEAKPKPKNHKRSLSELRFLFRESVKAGNEKKAWILAQTYAKRRNNRL